jgi:hypothetical protein
MNSIEPENIQGNPSRHPFNLTQVKLRFITNFLLSQSEQQALSKLWEIKKRDGESSWEYNQ